MVRIDAPSACSTGTRQLFTSAPSISTEQAPHSPSPQPSFVPVRRNCSRSTSSSRAMGWASRITARPFTRHCTRTLPAESGMNLLQHFEQHFRRDRNSTNVHRGRVGNCICDRRSGSVQRELTDAFCARRPVSVGNFLEEHTDGRNIHGSRHDVVGHLSVHHASLLPHDIFVQRQPNPLRYSAFNLSRREGRVNDFSHFLHGDKIVDVYLCRAHIHGNSRNIDCPRVGAVGVSLIFFVVPVQTARMFVFHK